jgi:Mn-containing catalase
MKLHQQKQTHPSASCTTFLQTLVNQPPEQLRALNLKDITTEELEHGLELVKRIKEGASAAQGCITKSMAHKYEHILTVELSTRQSHSSKEAHNIARCGP